MVFSSLINPILDSPSQVSLEADIAQTEPLQFCLEACLSRLCIIDPVNQHYSSYFSSEHIGDNLQCVQEMVQYNFYPQHFFFYYFYFFNFWGYNLMTTVLSSLSSFQTLSLLPFKLMTSLLISCCKHKYAYISKYSLFNLCVCVCVRAFSRLSIWYCIISWYACPWDRLCLENFSLPWLLAVLWVVQKRHVFFFSVHLVRLLLLFSSCLGYSNCFIGKHLYSVVNEALLDMWDISVAFCSV